MKEIKPQLSFSKSQKKNYRRRQRTRLRKAEQARRPGLSFFKLLKYMRKLALKDQGGAVDSILLASVYQTLHLFSRHRKGFPRTEKWADRFGQYFGTNPAMYLLARDRRSLFYRKYRGGPKTEFDPYARYGEKASLAQRIRGVMQKSARRAAFLKQHKEAFRRFGPERDPVGFETRLRAVDHGPISSEWLRHTANVRRTNLGPDNSPKNQKIMERLLPGPLARKYGIRAFYGLDVHAFRKLRADLQNFRPYPFVFSNPEFTLTNYFPTAYESHRDILENPFPGRSLTFLCRNELAHFTLLEGAAHPGAFTPALTTGRILDPLLYKRSVDSFYENRRQPLKMDSLNPFSFGPQEFSLDSFRPPVNRGWRCLFLSYRRDTFHATRSRRTRKRKAKRWARTTKKELLARHREEVELIPSLGRTGRRLKKVRTKIALLRRKIRLWKKSKS